MLRLLFAFIALSAAVLADAVAATPAGSLDFDRQGVSALRAAPLGSDTSVSLRWRAHDQDAASDTSTVSATLRRIDVYAPDARVFEATAEGLRELPRDPRQHFIAVGIAGQRIGLSLDPGSGAVEGVLLRQGRMYTLSGIASADGLALIAHDMSEPTSDGEPKLAACSGDLGAVAAAAEAAVPKALRPDLRQIGSARSKVATRQAVLAVDTDNELLQRKFANNTTNATAYVSALFTALNAIYSDNFSAFGLELRMVQGTVILRPSTTADPFTNTDSSATGAALNEFGNYWRLNQTGVSRAFALLLSGKSSNQNSASGIAWVLTSGNYCTSTQTVGGHYSVNQVFWNPGLSAADDAYLVGHELGHNLGAFHTHCANASSGAFAASNTIDRCFNGESGSGCYAGPQACPTAAESPTAPQGSLMSYCHLNGLGCGVSTEFHPTHVTQLDARLDGQPTSCIGPISTNQAPTLTLDSSSLTYAENAAAVQVSPTATANDAEANWNGGSLSAATSAGATPDDRVSIRTGGGLSVSGTTVNDGGFAFATLNVSGGEVSGSSILTATFNANATTARVQSLVRAIQFRTLGEAPATNNRTVAFTLRDGASASVGGNRTLSVAAVNDAPTLTLPASISGSEDQSGAIAPVSFADVDAGSASVVATFSVPAGTLSASSAAQVNVGGTATARTLTGSITNLNSFLATGLLTYTGAPNSNGNVTLTVTINDQGASGGGAQQAQDTVDLQIAAANDAPTVSAPASVQVGAGQTVALTGVSYADVDSPSGTITASATFAGGSGTFTASSGGGVAVTGSGTTNLSLSGTLTALNAFLASTPVQYTAAAAASGIVPISASINDQGNIGGSPLTGTATINASVIAVGTIFVDGFED